MKVSQTTGIVSENRIPFVIALMKQFLKANGMRHTIAALHHPSCNVLAEHAVQTLKKCQCVL